MNEDKKDWYEKKIKKYLVGEVDNHGNKYCKNKYLVNKRPSDEQLETLKRYHQVLKLNKRPTKCKKPLKSYATLLNHIQTVYRFGIFINKPYIEAKEKDIDAYLSYLLEQGIEEGGVNKTAGELKNFYSWFYYDKGLTKNLETPKLVEAIKIRKPKLVEITPNKVLLPEDIKKLINKCDNCRDKAIISLLFDSQARVGEILDCNIKDIIFDANGAVIKLDGKTGVRSLRLIDSVPYITQWVNEHPFKENENFPLFINFRPDTYGKRLSAQGVNLILKKIAKRSNITKPIHPHWFRHSGLDWLSKLGFNERDLRIRAGWGNDSPMVNIYLHYKEEAVNDKYMQIKGKKIIKEEFEKQKEELSPRTCPRCGKENPADAKYCNCGMIIDFRELKRFEEFKEEANRFTDNLMRTPIPNNICLIKGYKNNLPKVRCRKTADFKVVWSDICLMFDENGKIKLQNNREDAQISYKDVNDHLKQVLKQTKIYLNTALFEEDNIKIMPLIVTNAKLGLLKYSKDKIDSNGNLEDCELEEMQGVVYNFPEMITCKGNKIEIENPGIIGNDHMKSVFVVNIHHLIPFIKTMYDQE